MSRRFKSAVILAGWIGVLASAGAAADFQEKISFRIYGGMGSLGLGELEEVFGAKNDYFREAAPMFGQRYVGGLAAPHWGCDLAAEAVLKLSGRIGLGIGAGFLQAKKDTNYEIQGIGTGEVFQYEKCNTDIRAIPLSLNAYYFLPLSARLSAYIKGGLSYYLASAKVDNQSGHGVEATEIRRIELKDQYFGVQAGAGVLFRLTPRIGLLVETTARSVKFENWSGKVRFIDSREGLDVSVSGPLWTMDVLYDVTGKYYKEMTLSAEAPAAGYGVRNVHKGVIDFSGFFIRAGLEIRFGK